MEFLTLGIGTPGTIAGFLLVGLFDASAIVVEFGAVRETGLVRVTPVRGLRAVL
jgi:hypothetical protein